MLRRIDMRAGVRAHHYARKVARSTLFDSKHRLQRKGLVARVSRHRLADWHANIDEDAHSLTKIPLEAEQRSIRAKSRATA